MIKYRDGTNTNVMSVAKRSPYPREIAMGIKNLACLELSNIIGARPPKVVSVVRSIGRKR